MKVRFHIFVLVIAVVFFSCGSSEEAPAKMEKKDDLSFEVQALSSDEAVIVEPEKDEEIVVLKSNSVTLTEIKVDDNFGTQLKLNTENFVEGDNVLDFEIGDVKGVSISIAENNYSIKNFKSNKVKKELLNGNNVFLAFLVDKNGVSIKTNNAHVLKNVVLGGGGSLFDMKQPHLFYLANKTNEISILDFYLVNTSISEQGNRLKVNINNAEFIITKWAAYQITGLKKTNNSIRIQLIDKTGKLVDGPFNDSGERSF